MERWGNSPLRLVQKKKKFQSEVDLVGRRIRHHSNLQPHSIHHDHFTRFRRELGAMEPLKLILDELKSLCLDMNDQIKGVCGDV